MGLISMRVCTVCVGVITIRRKNMGASWWDNKLQQWDRLTGGRTCGRRRDVVRKQIRALNDTVGERRKDTESESVSNVDVNTVKRRSGSQEAQQSLFNLLYWTGVNPVLIYSAEPPRRRPLGTDVVYFGGWNHLDNICVVVHWDTGYETQCDGVFFNEIWRGPVCSVQFIGRFSLFLLPDTKSHHVNFMLQRT